MKLLRHDFWRGTALKLLAEQVRGRRGVGRPDDLLLLLGQVSCEAPAACREHPDAPVRDFDVGEYFCGRELVLLSVSKTTVRVTICSHVEF